MYGAVIAAQQVHHKGSNNKSGCGKITTQHGVVEQFTLWLRRCLRDGKGAAAPANIMPTEVLSCNNVVVLLKLFCDNLHLHKNNSTRQHWAYRVSHKFRNASLLMFYGPMDRFISVYACKWSSGSKSNRIDLIGR